MNKLVGKALNFISKNSPHILTGLGCAGLVSTALLTAKATIDASRDFHRKENSLVRKRENAEAEERIEINNEILDMYDNKYLVKNYWRYYIPPIVMGATSIACIVGANTVNTRRQAALATLYSISEKTLNDYREKVAESIGKTKEQKVRDEVVQKKLDENPLSKNEVIITGKGESLFYDTFSGRYFKSDMETMRRIQNDLNHDLMGQMWVSLNDLYFAIGLGGVKLGEEIGWTTDELIEITFTPKIADNQEPCIAIDLNAQTRGISR